MTATPQQTSLVFHDNGRDLPPTISMGHYYWLSLYRQCLQDTRLEDSCHRPKDLEIIVCHNYREPPVTVRSLKHLGIHDFVHLGGDIPVNKWQNSIKLKLVLNHLQNHCSAEYVLHLDAADVLVAADPSVILERFLSEFDCDGLFNSEKKSYPASDNSDGHDLTLEEVEKIALIEEFERSHSNSIFCHLNTGCYIGRRDYLIELLRSAIELEASIPNPKLRYNDQFLIRERYQTHFPNLQIDDKCRIFQCMYLIKQEEINSSYSLGHPWDILIRWWHVSLDTLIDVLHMPKLVTRKFRYYWSN